jgi:hypothetical protein
MRAALIGFGILLMSEGAVALDIKGVRLGQEWDSVALKKAFEDHQGATVACFDTGSNGCRGLTYLGQCPASLQLDRAEVWTPSHGYQVSRIALTFDYPKCVEALVPQLVSKYGKPDSDREAIVQKAFGEKATNRTLIWERAGQTLSILTHMDVNTSVITLSYGKDSPKPASL